MTGIDDYEASRGDEFIVFDGKERKVRTFEGGATRDSDEGKPDYEGFLSPLVIERYGKYMNLHRKQSDGSLRASDNWQQGSGIPLPEYLKSLWRHLMDLWLIHRGYKDEKELEDALCAIAFNCMGYLHETLKKRRLP